MNRFLLFSLITLLSVSTSVLAQKKKSKTKKVTVEQSIAEKMGYARTNKYWGPGTYYAFAPGAVNNKMAVNHETAMRDLTGISREDCITELGKQGFVAVPPKEIEKWYGKPKDKSNVYYYSPDKSYILFPQYQDMEKSAQPDYMPYAVKSISRFVLLPKQDSAKVIEMAWQYMRDLHDMKVILASFGSTFKKADPKAYPSEVAGSTGWTSMRAGTFLLRMIDKKPVGTWTRNEDIVRRTIGNNEYELNIMGSEIDFAYRMHVMLQKEGYVIRYDIIALTMATLEPGANWQDEHKKNTEAYKMGEKADKDAVALYKKAPLPPVLEDLNKLLHIK
jgi:hypothetical protein